MPAVASAMPLIVDSEADEMAVRGSHRRMSITMGFVSRLPLLALAILGYRTVVDAYRCKCFL